MSQHVAEIAWRGDEQFRSGRYSRRHEWRFDGGAVVAGSSSPHLVPEPMSDGHAVDPEEALVAAVSSCHMLWFLSLAHGAGLDVRSYSDRAEGEMGQIGPNRTAMTRIVLRPIVEYAGRQPVSEEIDRLHHDAHRRCFIANSLTSEIVVEPATSPGG